MFIKNGEKLRDYKQVNRENEQNSNKRKDEFDLIGFEDLIGNDIKTKFSYIEVDQKDFGLTDVELLFADDKLLNQMISTKKFFPYRNGKLSEKDLKRINKMRNLV